MSHLEALSYPEAQDVHSLANLPINVYVRNSANQNPIGGAQVTSTYDDGAPVPFGSGVTDGNGYLKLFITGTYYNVHISVSAKGYTSTSYTIFHQIQETVNLYLDPNTQVTFSESIYAIDTLNHRLQNVKINVDGVEAITDVEGLAKFFLSAGVHSVTVQGPGLYSNGITYVRLDFSPFTQNITVSQDGAWTISVQQQKIIGGAPPNPLETPTSFLLKYGPMLVAGCVVLGVAGYAMSGGARLLEAVKA